MLTLNGTKHSGKLWGKSGKLWSISEKPLGNFWNLRANLVNNYAAYTTTEKL